MLSEPQVVFEGASILIVSLKEQFTNPSQSLQNIPTLYDATFHREILVGARISLRGYDGGRSPPYGEIP